MRIRTLLLLSLSTSVALAAQGAPKLGEKLEEVRQQKLAIEKALIESEKSNKAAQSQLSRLKTLQRLQREEHQLTEKRMSELGKYLGELQGRKEEVQKKIQQLEGSLRVKFSKLVHPNLYESGRLLKGDEGDAEARIRANIVASVTLLELKELETLHADFQDAEDLESRIEQEKQQIASLMQDITEQESLIAFHKKLREDLSQEKKSEHLRQLEDYRKLKVSEVEIEKMICLFQERQKLEHDEDRKKPAIFAFRPKSLPWPLKGKMIGSYGQQLDEKTGLHIFKKGIEILTMTDSAPVIGVLDGKVQYAGEIPGKGKVLILEHPHALYTIYAGMSQLIKKAGDEVKASEKLGSVENQAPLYFEIRARNVAIDPLKWLQ